MLETTLDLEDVSDLKSKTEQNLFRYRVLSSLLVSQELAI